MSNVATATNPRFFIAVPASDHSAGIYAIGYTPDGVMQDIRSSSGWHEPVIEQKGFGWIVRLDGGEERDFPTEAEAERFAESRSFAVLECTERLYRHIMRDGPQATHARYATSTERSNLADIVIDEDVLDRIVAQVEAGFEGCTAQGEWQAETALEDAHDYVDAYVADDESVDEELRDALDDRQMRLAGRSGRPRHHHQHDRRARRRLSPASGPAPR